jgi:hypothetical protein
MIKVVIISFFQHCRVPNFLPSISAAIGRQPQAFIWQLAIILHAIPRFAISYMYFDYYSKVIRRRARTIASIACIINVVENVALIGLTLWTSLDSYGELKDRLPLPILSKFYFRNS